MVTSPFPSATLIEIFPSIQGEGLYVGSPQVFIRFHGCSLQCRYCDTPETHRPSAPCRVIDGPAGNVNREITNPVSAAALTALIETHYPGYSFFSLTGGEPLEQAPFIATWLTSFKEGRACRILLETAGVHVEGLKRVLPWIDVVSMDLKPQSATGMAKDFWQHHHRFLHAIRDSQSPPLTYVKVVIGEALTASEHAALTALMRLFPDLEYYFQPLTPLAPAGIDSALSLALAYHRQGFKSRFLPQIHPLLALK